jgi:L-threonylcarbamoyladenylate synthase
MFEARPMGETRNLQSDQDAALAALRAGELAILPTETVYGLAADASNPAAVAKVFAAKGRPQFNPLIAHVADLAAAERIAVFDDRARALAAAFWPGPLTLVLVGGEGRLPDTLRGPEGGFAVRHTSHAAVARLIERLDQPLTSTSANRPGEAPAAGPQQIESLFRASYEAGELLILDGGILGNVPPSTIVDCTTSNPTLIREGALPRDELRRAVGRLAP